MSETAPDAATPVFDAHQCENACGRLADVIITTLSDSGVMILCQPCHMAMMVAVAMEAGRQLDADQLSGLTPGG